LSDAIARDEYGAYSTNPLHLFGVQPDEVFQRTRVVGGFNQTWGMPLAQAPAMQAGLVDLNSLICDCKTGVSGTDSVRPVGKEGSACNASWILLIH